ncbi:nucleotidyl transferase AbiEii/AbiGii toxin family protein [Chryseosolibacter indicus]|uniref:Nucleotidyl transferase AbiEii/AbiGii toxin family protein n=1 Tax=Chryseosolibacter indicus TaxID=2782351 RepID=A0ABS5VWR3_9BACT|nr:nucleotidyl transferase AbiEii/AbiGii toxin family protein [Chryseosolibacter indicus]MBT1705277.1 nucleotidyl transferase AbiEii/AbiGii toxin family protein [Chryseosolibacter indicus]
MTFHKSNDFVDAIESAAAHFKMRTIFIEKDYWVTHVLKNLSASKLVDEVIFKGGTSLSKAHDCINRFSEDIDLAILKTEGMSGNQITNKIKETEKIVSAGLDYFQHPLEEKKGRNRRTFYHYTKAITDQNFGQIKDHIQLEINAFTQPVPYENKVIQSYVGQFLAAKAFDEIVKQFGLESFEVNVLTRERTVFEKLLSLVRLSYEGTEKVKGKIRHIYDIHQLLNQTDLKGKILIEDNFKILKWVMEDDAANGIFAGDWLEKPLTDSPLFKDFDSFWKELESTYTSELGELVWSELPKPALVVSSFKEIKSFLEVFDKTAKKTKQ